VSDLIQVHPSERVTLPNGDEAEIDVGMVPLTRALWALGYQTKGCCQDFGDSIEKNGHRTTTPDDDRQRFAAFYRGQAWIKMPMPDATRVIGMLGKNPLFDERVRRWTHPEAWMSIVYIFPNGQGEAELMNAAQLHFPRTQIGELVEVLNRMT
jgi:hypothetical protein